MRCVLLVFVRVFFQVIHVADMLNDCICCNIDNRFGENGVVDCAKALKVNSTLVEIDFRGE